MISRSENVSIIALTIIMIANFHAENALLMPTKKYGFHVSGVIETFLMASKLICIV